MCGIAGVFEYAGRGRMDRAVVEEMTALLRHRGPDDGGTYFSPEGDLGLGHRRLSIIDLTSGAQPMTDADRELWIVFNGEIYNFPELKRELAAVWQSLPDKPVFFLLLAAWLALFQFWGNSTFGYVDTPSLFKWMLNAYNAPGSEDAHGNLVPWVVLVLLWWKRQELISLPKAAWGPGLLILMGALLAHLVGYLIQQPRISIAALFLGAFALIGVVWGRVFLRSMFFPYVLFVFCIPVGSLAETITFPLRRLASALAAMLVPSWRATRIDPMAALRAE